MKKLEEQLTETKANIYKVKYIDENAEENVVLPQLDEEPLSLLRNFYVLKKAHYSYEKEVRVILFGEPNDSAAIKINDPVLFIDRIFVSPFAEDWFLNLVKKLVQEKNKLNIDVVKSQIKVKS